MADNIFNKVYQLGNVNWPDGVNAANGVPLETKFSVTGEGGTLTVIDDDLILEDNNNPAGGSTTQSLDYTQQVLATNFGSNVAGDYVWSRAWQTVEDEFGNVGRIYQIRIGTWDHSFSNGPHIVENDATNIQTYYAFSGPLVIMPGVTYTVKSTFNGNGNQPYATFEEPLCFHADVQIETDRGLVRAADLSVGSMVMTRDAGLQPVRWIGRMGLDRAALDAEPRLRPIRIAASALGRGIPARDLVVSPQHRVLVRSRIAQRMFGASEVLVAAKQLLALEGVDAVADADQVVYVHFMFDDHQIVFANGAEAESLYVGAQTLRMIGEDAMDELLLLFPELRDAASLAAPARPMVGGKMARKLADRHIKHHLDLVSVAQPH